MRVKRKGLAVLASSAMLAAGLMTATAGTTATHTSFDAWSGYDYGGTFTTRQSCLESGEQGYLDYFWLDYYCVTSSTESRLYVRLF